MTDRSWYASTGVVSLVEAAAAAVAVVITLVEAADAAADAATEVTFEIHRPYLCN